MKAVEAANEDLRDILPKTYTHLANRSLVELLKLMSSIPMDIEGDAFGKVYEYFLGKFAMSEGQKGGEFFTPTALVRLIVYLSEDNPVPLPTVVTSKPINRRAGRADNADRMLAAVFGFDYEGKKAYWIYSIKRGSFYPLVLSGYNERDNAAEMRLAAVMEEDRIPVERDLTRWYALWGIPF